MMFGNNIDEGLYTSLELHFIASKYSKQTRGGQKFQGYCK